MVAWAVLTTASFAQHVEITADQTQITLNPDLTYWASFGPYPGPAYQAFRDGQFTKDQRPISLGINHASETWFGTTLRNASFDDGRAGDRFVLTLDAPLIVGYRLFLIRQDGLTETLLDYSVFQPFDAAQHSVTRLKSVEFTLAPGEEVTVLAHLQLGILPAYSATVFRSDALNETSFRWGVTATAFYAFSLSLLLLGLGFQIAMRSWLGVGYVVMFLLFLGLIAYSDGLLFRVVYPGTPTVHHTLGVGLTLCAAVVGYGMLSLSLLRTARRRSVMIRNVVRALIALCLLVFAVSLWFPSNWLMYLAFVLIVLAVGLNAFVPREISQSGSNPNLGIRTLTVFAAGVVMVALVLGVLGRSDWISTRALLKITFAILAMTVMTFLTRNLVVLRQRYVRAVEARLAAMEAQSEKTRQLLETERAYNRARDTAAARQRQLATASHDIKQPLMSLRSTFDAIASEMDQSVRDRLQNAFLYLEDLSKSYVDTTVDIDSAEDLPSGDVADVEAYALSVPLRTVQQMFKGEAVSKGVRLGIVETSLETTAPPIVLMRILTNLVSNAVKNTEKGGVVIGLHRATQSICVYDTGVGMSAEELGAFGQAYVKGTGSTGHGLGLSVCYELAAKNAMELSVRSRPSRGTVFCLSLAAYLP